MVSNNRVTYNFGLISKDQTDIKLDRISQVRVDQSIFQRMMNTGNVLVYVSGVYQEPTAYTYPSVVYGQSGIDIGDNTATKLLLNFLLIFLNLILL